MELNTEDCTLIVEALVQWAGNPRELDTPRGRRAYELAELIAATHGFTASELVATIDNT